MSEETLAELEAIAATKGALRRWLRLRQVEDRQSCLSGQAGLPVLHNLIAAKARLQRRIVMWHRVQELFHYWHVFHKPFAIVMYLFLIVHIVVVSMTGYGFG